MKTAHALLAAMAGIAIMSAGVNAQDSQWVSPHFADNPLVGKAFAIDGTRQAAFDDILQRAVQAKYVLIGEIHPNPDHHRLQAQILQHMLDNGRKPAIVFEMATRAQQPVLDAISAKPPADLNQIAGMLEWSETGWPDFAMYRPLFEIALKNGLKLRAGNLERSTVRRLGGREGAPLDSAERAALGLDKPLAAKSNEDLLQTIAEGHCNMMPESILPRMADIQRARDFTMAKALLDPANTDGAVLIAGAGHTRLDWGVGAILSADESNGVLSLAFMEATSDLTNAMLPNKTHHYTFITPRFDVTDHCAQFKKMQNTDN